MRSRGPDARRAIAGALLLATLPPGPYRPVRAQEPASPAADEFTFVVLGHVRGNESGPHYLLGSLVAEVRALHPDLVFLTGDIIWGDVRTNPADSASVEREWDVVDSAFAAIGAPVYRVPGNHDINDLVTRDIYARRYGLPPAFVDYGGYRFLLLSSSWIPADGDTRKRLFIRGKDLDEAQIAFLRRALAPDEARRGAFVLMHHLLWWEEDAPWWRDVHPLLREGGVRAVFGGDYGPMKFSHMRRDGIDYFQSSIEGDVRIPILRAREESRLLSAQFDNYLVVRVRGADVSVDVRPFAAVESGHFTPQRWREIHADELADAGAAARLRRRLASVWGTINSPKRLLALGVVVALIFGAGFAAASLWSRRLGR
ncbi:MAG: metallophosphoesterase family protein [Gemmatimonadota bacterium]